MSQGERLTISRIVAYERHVSLLYVFFFFSSASVTSFFYVLPFPFLYISFWIHLMHLFSVAKLNSSYNRSLILRLSPQILSLSKISDSRYSFNTQSITGRYSRLIIVIYFSILFLNFALFVRVHDIFFPFRHVSFSGLTAISYRS